MAVTSGRSLIIQGGMSVMTSCDGPLKWQYNDSGSGVDNSFACLPLMGDVRIYRSSLLAGQNGDMQHSSTFEH